MRRVLFAILSLLPITLCADSYTFNFSDPDSLKRFNIEFLDPDYNGAEISLQNVVFTSRDNCVSISMIGRTGHEMGAALQTGWQQDDGTYDHYIFLLRGTRMLIKGNGVELDSFEFGEDSSIGNMQLLSPSNVGIVDARKQSWKADGAEGVTELEYICNGQLPAIRSAIVTYHIPQSSLKPSINPFDGNDKLFEFQNFELAFNKKVKKTATAKATLKGPNNFTKALNITGIDDYNIRFSLPEGTSTITTIGDYEIIIDEFSIITNDNEGFYNQELTYHFSIVPNYAKFELESIEPAEGIVDILNDSIKLVFSDVVSNTISSERIYITDQNGKRVRTARLSKSTENPKVVYVCYEEDNKLPIPSDILGEKIGDYTLTIPEGYVNNYLYDESKEDLGKSEGAQYNPTIVKTYNVGNAVYPSKEMQHSANSLLENKGVGYPSVESEARKTLQNHLSLIEDGIITDEMLKADTAAFYAETDIEYPKDNRYYKLSAISAISDTLYLQYVDNRITLTKDSTLAVHFKAQFHEDSTLTLVTPDGRYLQQFMPEVANTSASYDAKRHNLEIAHFNLEGKSAKECFGLWSINAWIATDEDSQDISAYALVNFTEKDFATSLLNRSLRHFDNTKSNAFFLSETDAPVPDATYSLNPASGSKLETLQITLKFTHTDNVGIKDGAMEAITLTGNNGYKYNLSRLKTVEGTGNEFVLYFDVAKAGTYTLIIPKGTFTWVSGGKKVEIQQINATYIIDKDVDFAYDFINKYNVYLYKVPSIDQKVRDIDLNDIFTLVIYSDETFGVSDNVVKIININSYKTYAQGHLVIDESFVDPIRSPSRAFQLVLDEPIKAGDLPVGTYQFDIPAATFGDANFAAWLKNPQSVSKTDCCVNGYWNPFVAVDNDLANLHFTPQNLVSSVETLSEITVTFPHHQVVTIPDQSKNVVDVYERYTGRFFTTSFVPVEGSTNQFRFASEERLTQDTSNGGYKIIVPKGLFKSDEEYMPTYDDVELYYYAVKIPDAIDNIQGETQPEVFYDLAGRRVKDTSKPGIYVVNGRKVIVK